MAYTNIDKPSDYFNTLLYTGNGSTQSITGVGFKPDFFWTKGRASGGYNNILCNIIQGTGVCLSSNLTNAELARGVTSFNTDGVSLDSNADLNGNGINFASWNWLAGGTGVSNTQGSITSTVSANTTSGFSIVSYTGTGANATVGHGLGVAPKIIFVKQRNDVNAWQIMGNGNFVRLSFDTGADRGNFGFTFASSTFAFNTSLPADTAWNGNGSNYIAYCFAEKKGFSKFGKYTGNGSTDGTFVYTGFKPAFVILKRTDSSGFNWVISDDKRNTYNPVASYLHPNTSDAESTGSRDIDFLSNGWKLKNSNTTWNASGGGYIYMAFAENPFTTSTGIPTTAR